MQSNKEAHYLTRKFLKTCVHRTRKKYLIKLLVYVKNFPLDMLLAFLLSLEFVLFIPI